MVETVVVDVTTTWVDPWSLEVEAVEELVVGGSVVVTVAVGEVSSFVGAAARATPTDVRSATTTPRTSAAPSVSREERSDARTTDERSRVATPATVRAARCLGPHHIICHDSLAQSEHTSQHTLKRGAHGIGHNPFPRHLGCDREIISTRDHHPQHTSGGENTHPPLVRTSG